MGYMKLTTYYMSKYRNSSESVVYIFKDVAEFFFGGKLIIFAPFLPTFLKPSWP